MTPLLITLLLANALYNFIVWPAFYRRVAKDPRGRDAGGRATTFLRVHVVLVSVALLLGLASAVAAVVALVTG